MARASVWEGAAGLASDDASLVVTYIIVMTALFLVASGRAERILKRVLRDTKQDRKR